MPSRVDEVTAEVLIQLAKRHLSNAKMKDSAELCLKDAESLFASGDFKSAIKRATDSLRYSVGINIKIPSSKE